MVSVLHWLLLQQVTNLAAVMAHCGISPKIGVVFKFFVDLCNLREICVSNMVIHWAGG